MKTKEGLKQVYDRNAESYERVCKLGKDLVEKALIEKKIDILHISYRVKSFESLYEKITRKNYQDPNEEIEDICGLRIICFYSNDLERINKIIQETFRLNDFVDKLQTLDADRFGYRSSHYIVGLPQFPEYAELSTFKIEIQTRTILMHAWAHIQGKLEYKETEHIPREFRRKLYQLSAILGLADGQFQSLKMQKDDLREFLAGSNSNFSASTELNIDTFLSFLDSYFPLRIKNYRYSKLLMKVLLRQGIDFGQIIESYEKVHNHLFGFEQEIGLTLTQEEALKVMLSIRNPSILSFLQEDSLIKRHLKSIKKWSRIVEN